jgi:hypothetical protein
MMRSSRVVVDNVREVEGSSVNGLDLLEKDQLMKEALERVHRREILDRLLGDLQQIER